MKVAEERFCSNCRAELSAAAGECPSCGVYAGDLYDERAHRPRTRMALFGTLFAIAVVAGGAAVWWNTRDSLPGRARTGTAEPAPVRVVGDRPGGARRARGAVVNEAEAILLVRRHLVATTGAKSDCIALMGGGFRQRNYVVTAYDSCNATRLGRWSVDGKTGDVTRAR